MATLKVFQYSEMPPRRKIRYFQFAMLRMARFMFTGPGATANYITANQYTALERFYHKPFWKSPGMGTDLLPWAKATTTAGGAGANYRIGDVLTLVQGTAAGGKVVVARINAAGGVTAVLPLVPGTGYCAGTATVTAVNSAGAASSGTGAIVGLRPVYGTVVDVLDQVRVDVQNIAGLQSAQQFAANSGTLFTTLDGPGIAGGGGPSTMPLANYSEAYSIKDWGNPKTTLKWLTSTVAAASIGTPATYSGGAVAVGQVYLYNAKYYMCYKAISATTNPGTGLPGVAAIYAIGPTPFYSILGNSLGAGSATDANWVILPTGGSACATQLINPVGVTIASMIARLSAVIQGLV